ncbi:nuclear transport factor 2 family protein [Alteromonas lipotrueiana]|uniref:nuclear transport factor 2 family protein n=1 Tax=Alteromonas lipotrueiana TaxID=2803815 RepID=UPI001C4957BB|nr:nuclear transport factor 2 family protein [Alteromonas lipotrueiana]
MIRYFLFSLLLMVSFTGNAHGDKPDTPHDDLSGNSTEPGHAVISFHRALKQQNQEKAKSLLAEDVVIFESGRIEKSAREYSSHHMLSDMKYLSKMKSELIFHQVGIQGDRAISMSVSNTKDEKGKSYKLMQTAALRKVDGRWIIYHLHWSNDR